MKRSSRRLRHLLCHMGLGGAVLFELPYPCQSVCERHAYTIAPFGIDSVRERHGHQSHVPYSNAARQLP